MHLTLEEAPAVEAAIHRLQESLAAVDALRPVPIKGLHLTMTGVGFTDEVSAGRLDEVAQRVFAQAEAMSAAPLVLDGVLVGAESIMLRARSASWLDQLLTSQRDAVQEVLGPRAWGPFHPHVSIAYADGVAAIGDVVDHLVDDVAPLAPLVVHSPTLTLMRLGRDRRIYEWDVVRQLPLNR